MSRETNGNLPNDSVKLAGTNRVHIVRRCVLIVQARRQGKATDKARITDRWQAAGQAQWPTLREMLTEVSLTIEPTPEER